MALPNNKKGPPSSRPGGPPARKREDEELAKKSRKADDDEDEEEEEDEDLDDEEEDEDEDEEEGEDEEEEDDEEEELDEDELDEEDLDEEDLDEEDDEDLDDDEDFDDDDEDFDDDDEDEDEDDDDDDDDEDDEDDEDEDEDGEDEDEDEGPRKKKKKKSKSSRGEATAVSTSDKAKTGSAEPAKATSAAAVAAGAAAAGAVAAGVAAAASKRQSGVSAKIPAGTESKTAPAPISKRASAVTARTGRPSAASKTVSGAKRGDPNAPKVAKKDPLKAAAIIACGVLFLACIGVGIMRWDVISKRLFGGGGGTASTGPKEVLPPDVQKMMDAYDNAEKWYAEGQQKAESDKLPDLRLAADLMRKAANAWGEVSEFPKTFKGFEEKRSKAESELGNISKKMIELNKKIDSMEAAERIERSKKNREQNDSGKTATPGTGGAKTTNGKVVEIDEAEYKKWETDDPSEYEKYKKMLETGKAKFKDKNAPAPAPETPPAVEAPKDAAKVIEIDEDEFKKWETDDPSEYEKYKKMIDTGKARFKKKGAAAPEAPAKNPALPKEAPTAPAE